MHYRWREELKNKINCFMTYQYRIFYSWQSDNREARSILHKALNTVVKCLKKRNIGIEIIEGGGSEGFISIEDAVRMKIQKCDIFIGDITPVGNVSLKSKLLPNANVMYEMGIATECMSADRVLAVAMAGDWEVENLPFDFNHYSMVLFRDPNDLEYLESKILNCVQSTDNSSKRQNSRFFSDSLIQRNIESGKYLPSTFLENRNAKDIARLFVAPHKMYQFVYGQLTNMNFDFYNRKRRLEGFDQIFKLDLSSWTIQQKAIDMPKLYTLTDELHKYLISKHDKLASANNTWSLCSKLERHAKSLDIMNKRLMVITSQAGFGKTNFVCDLVKNILQPDEIPYVFVNAYELAPELLAESVAREYNFIGDGSLESMIVSAERYCQQHMQYLIIVIDGLNEHPQYRLFQNNLIRVLNAVLKYQHVKIIMTCRKNFYDNNYLQFREAFSKELCEVELNNGRRGNELEKFDEECLFERYEKFFKVCGKTHPAIRNILKENLLLLRIFYETYQGQNISGRTIIDYIDMYERYYNMLCEKIERIITQSTDVLEVRDVPKRTFEHIMKWMIESNVFKNIPYSSVVEQLNSDEKASFISFLNANLVLQHDMSDSGNGIQDVINFTFEEIRDYLIAKYLIEKISKNNLQEFRRLVELHTLDSSNLSEGLRRFIFLYCRFYSYRDVLEIISSQPWFEETYSTYIWDVKDDCLTKDDEQKVKSLIISYPQDTIKRLVYYHWSPTCHDRINLNTLFDVLDEMGTKEKDSLLEQVWPTTKSDRYHWGRHIETEREMIVRVLQTGIDRRKSEESNSLEIDVLQKLLDYLTDSVQDVYTPTKIDKDNSFNFYGYDLFRYLMTVHKGTKRDFLKKAGVRKGFAKRMFSDLYDSVFAEALDVANMYEQYYSNEYDDLFNFISMHYSIPERVASRFINTLNSGDYRIIDFSGIDYGNDQFENFFMSDEMFVRMYNWYNWIENENKN